MSNHSYPDSEPAWVVDPENQGRMTLRWLTPTGRPADEIGVNREIDVPGMHTPPAANRILSIPLARQLARLWAPNKAEGK